MDYDAAFGPIPLNLPGMLKAEERDAVAEACQRAIELGRPLTVRDRLRLEPVRDGGTVF